MPKRVLTGTVVSDKADKTVVVRVERRVKHPLYGKIIRRSKKYHAHDEANAFKAGEQVRIQERAPLSKLKTWEVIDRIGVAKATPVEIVEGATQPVEEKKKAPAKAKAPKPVPKPAAKTKKAKAKEPAEADA
jgi:small subunit ribosomal protein S17